jgi:hypothetical protein
MNKIDQAHPNDNRENLLAPRLEAFNNLRNWAVNLPPRWIQDIILQGLPPAAPRPWDQPLRNFQKIQER